MWAQVTGGNSYRVLNTTDDPSHGPFNCMQFAYHCLFACVHGDCEMVLPNKVLTSIRSLFYSSLSRMPSVCNHICICAFCCPNTCSGWLQSLIFCWKNAVVYQFQQILPGAPCLVKLRMWCFLKSLTSCDPITPYRVVDRYQNNVWLWLSFSISTNKLNGTDVTLWGQATHVCVSALGHHWFK